MWTLLIPACISEATSQGTTPSSDPSSLHRAIYTARSHLALSPSQTKEASVVIKPFLPAPAAKATDAFIRYLTSSSKESIVDELRDLVIELEGAEEGNEKIEEGLVRTLAGTVFVLEGENEEAVATLTEGAAKSDIEWWVQSGYLDDKTERDYFGVGLMAATPSSFSYYYQSTERISLKQHTRT
jgi:coatomer protein complex subunit epsilon